MVKIFGRNRDAGARVSSWRSRSQFFGSKFIIEEIPSSISLEKRPVSSFVMFCWPCRQGPIYSPVCVKINICKDIFSTQVFIACFGKRGKFSIRNLSRCLNCLWNWAYFSFLSMLAKCRLSRVTYLALVTFHNKFVISV